MIGVNMSNCIRPTEEKARLVHAVFNEDGLIDTLQPGYVADRFGLQEFLPEVKGTMATIGCYTAALNFPLKHRCLTWKHTSKPNSCGII